MSAPNRKVVARAGLALAALTVAALSSLTLFHAPRAAADPSQVPGMDVSGWQRNVDWPAAWTAGARFAYVKATEGTNYRNPYFAQQYNGSYQVGMIRGAYHFARPDMSGGAAQADYFVAHGGGWSPDGKTLPPMLDIEYNPQGATCYGLSQPAMVDWIRSFSTELHAKTSRWPMLYTTTDWWQTCTGNSAAFGDTHPLFIARYASTAGSLPNGWRYYTMWQYSDSGAAPGDQDTFAGSMQQLIKLAGGEAAPSSPSSAPMSATTTTPPTTTPPPSTTTTTARPTTTHPSPTTTTTAPPSTTPSDALQAQPINGLVWAGPHQANPPQSLRPNPKAGALTARAAPPRQEAPATTDANAGLTTVVPPPTTTHAPATTRTAQAGAPHDLARTGTDTARLIVFGAALVLGGASLLLLVRVLARR